MAETQDLLAPIEGPGVTVELQPRFHAASLRYFELDGAFAGIVRRVTGLNLPTSLGATHGTGAAEQSVTLLAWRSPSETTLLTTDAELLDALQTAAAALSDGCVVDQRGGLLVLRVRGNAVPELVAKQAGHGAMPAIGESRRTRFANVALLLVKVRAEETLFIVDRIYAPHAMAAIRVSAADIDAPLFD